MMMENQTIEQAKIEELVVLEREKCAEIIGHIPELEGRALYMPNIRPNRKAKYIFIAMEPSLNRKEFDAVNNNIEHKGFRNFMTSAEDFIVHWCIRNFLTTDGSYYITDISKLAMAVKGVSGLRQTIYPYWDKLLEDDVSLFGIHEPTIICFGNDSKRYASKVLQRCDSVIHYSSTNNRYQHRMKWIKRNSLELEFSRFDQAQSWAENIKSIISNADALLETLLGLDAGLKAEILDKLINKFNRTGISSFDKQLIFIYFTRFNEIREKAL